MYLAHYDLLKTKEGRNYLLTNNLEFELLRILIGTDPIQDILVKFRKKQYLNVKKVLKNSY